MRSAASQPQQFVDPFEDSNISLDPMQHKKEASPKQQQLRGSSEKSRRSLEKLCTSTSLSNAFRSLEVE